jgi:hypothetical protein
MFPRALIRTGNVVVEVTDEPHVGCAAASALLPMTQTMSNRKCFIPISIGGGMVLVQGRDPNDRPVGLCVCTPEV